MAENNQDRSQDKGQEGIDRETEQRNRENETGQQGGQSKQSDTTVSERTGQTEGKASTGQSASGKSGFVGSQGDQSGDYLTKGEENKNIAPEGQGAQDVETGQSQDKDATLDDGSAANR
jgi:hypothetical protein